MTAGDVKPAEGLAAQHRREIVDAAERLVKEKGLHNLKLRDIAKESGKSLGNLYNYFQNKEAIIEALVEREKDRFLSTISRTKIELLEGETPVDRMRRNLEIIADAYMEPESVRLAIFIASEALVNPRVYEIMVVANRKLVEHVIDLVRDDPASSFENQDPELLEARVVVTRAFLESLRGAISFHPGADRKLLKRVTIDRLLAIWVWERAKATGKRLVEVDDASA